MKNQIISYRYWLYFKKEEKRQKKSPKFRGFFYTQDEIEN